VKIQFIFFNDENHLLLQPAAGKRRFPVGEVGFGFAVLRVNFMPRATLPALGEIAVTFHLADRHGSNPCGNARKFFCDKLVNVINFTPGSLAKEQNFPALFYSLDSPKSSLILKEKLLRPY